MEGILSGGDLEWRGSEVEGILSGGVEASFCRANQGMSIGASEYAQIPPVAERVQIPPDPA